MANIQRIVSNYKKMESKSRKLDSKLKVKEEKNLYQAGEENKSGVSDVILNRMEGKKSQNKSINAAAIQDHIMRKMQSNSIRPAVYSGGNRGGQSMLARSGQQIMGENISSTTTEHTVGWKMVQNREDTQAKLGVENKRMKYIQNLTLAQRLGLVSKPSLPLSMEEWKSVESKTKERISPMQECPICIEPLGMHSQIILSCSHVFHKKCLDSFERYVKVKVCPICRQQQYDKKEYAQGPKMYLQKCIIRIQTIMRGYLCRIKFYELLLENPPKNKNLQMRVFGYKFSRISKKMRSTIDKQKLRTNKLLTEVNQNIEEYQDVFSELHDHAPQIRREYEKQLFLIKAHTSPIMWDEVAKKAEHLNQNVCSICLGHLSSNKNNGIYLLSCAHKFHEKCLNSFEKFDIHQTLSCPVCRAHYLKKLMEYERNVI